MDREQLNPFAQILLDGYVATLSYSRQFNDDYAQPPTLMAKAHHFRSVVQAAINGHDRYQLGRAFSEFGRVEVTDLEQSATFVLKSQGAVAAERNGQTRPLFDSTPFLRSAERLLVYAFDRTGLSLALAGARRRERSRRLEIVGVPTLIDTWSFEDGGADSFPQGKSDPFSELGHLNIDGDEEAGE